MKAQNEEQVIDLSAPGGVEALLELHRRTFGSIRMDANDKGGDGDDGDGDGADDKGEKPGSDGKGGDSNDNSGGSDDEKDLPESVKAILAKNRREARDAEKRAKAAEKAVAEERKKNMTEAEKEKAEAAEAKAENAKLKVENMRLKVGTKLKVPDVLLDRIQGETEADMEADAKALMAAFPNAGGTTNTRRTTNDAGKTGKSGGPSMNDLLRTAAGRG